MAGKSITGNPEFMKEINKRLVLKLIRDESPVSRSTIAARLDLALPTVMRLVDTLISEELVKEVGKGDSSGGRKPVMLEINDDSHYIVGVDIRRIVSAIIIDINGSIISMANEVTRVWEGPEGTINQVLEMINKLIENAAIPREKVRGIGIGIPGTNFKSGELIEGSVFRGWENVDIESLIKSKIEFPVFIENIARVLAIGELYFGVGNGVKNFISIFADYGTGSGIVLNGDMYRGKDNVAGEFGHTVVKFDGEKCYCGNNGCLEMYTSTPYIIKMVFDEIEKGGNSLISSKIDVSDRSKLDFQLIVEALQQGDSIVTEVIAKSGRIMGIGIANLVNLYNPDLIVMSGEIIEKCPSFIESAREAFPKYVFSQKAQNVPIVASSLGETAGPLGAAALVLRKMFKLLV